MITDRTNKVVKMADAGIEDPSIDIWAMRACGTVVGICNESDTLSKDEIVEILEQLLPLIPTDLLVKTAELGEYLSSLNKKD